MEYLCTLTSILTWPQYDLCEYCRNQRELSNVFEFSLDVIMRHSNLEPRSRSQSDPDRLCYISFNASWREKQIGTNRTALSLFYQKLEAKNAFDSIWPRMTRRRDQWVKHTYGSWTVAWDKTILRLLAWYLSFLRTKAFDTFSHCLIMFWSENRPDPRSLKSKFWGISFVVLMPY